MSDLPKEELQALTFYYTNKLTVVFAPEVERFFEDLKASYDYRLETGGILAGTLSNGPIITITDVTSPQLQDVRQRYRFKRSDAGHQTLMDQLWDESGYQKMYLGEWHTHRESRPVPSRIDTFGWTSIARRRQNAPWMLFLILGQTELRLWTIYKGEVKELRSNAE